MFFEILLLFGLFIFIRDHFRRKQLIRTLRNIPLVSEIPFIGSIMVLLQMNPDNYDTKWHEFVLRFGKTFCASIFGRLFVVTVDHGIVDAILSSQVLLRKSIIYQMLNVWLGDSLLLSNGQTWREMRKTITPAFHFNILEKFVDVFDRQTDIFLKKMTSLANGRTIVNAFEPVGLLTLDIISETAMGVAIKAQQNSKSEFVQAVNDVTEIMANRFVRPHLSIKALAPSIYRAQDKGIRIMHEFTEKIIADRKQALLLEANGKHFRDDSSYDSADLGVKKRLAFLDVLLHSTLDDKPLSDKRIRDEVNTFMFEGHDTTTSAISFCLYALSRNREVQQKLFEEIRSHFGDNLSCPVRYADLQKLNYLNCVIKESLRLYPPIPAVGRWLERDLKLDGCTIPAGSNILILLWEMLRDPEIFEDPNSFKPERHLSGNVKVSGYTNIPFSAGPRNCIGQRFALLEIRTVIIKVLRNFELLPLGEEVNVSMKLVLRSKNGVNLGLKPRVY